MKNLLLLQFFFTLLVITVIEELNFVTGNMDDLNDIFSVVDITGWGETKDDIRSMIANPDNEYILLISPENEIFATTLTVKNDQIGFIGHVIVLPEFRGMGLGEEIMKEAINYLKFRGCKTIILDAVQKAKTLYERVGFIFKMNSYRYELDISTKDQKQEYENKIKENLEEFSISNNTEEDFLKIADLDKEVLGCNRKNLLKFLFESFPEFSFNVKDAKGKITGYSFGEFKHKTLYLRSMKCSSKKMFAAFIDKAVQQAFEKYSLEKVKIGILEICKDGLAILKELGFKETSYSLRMFYGKETKATFNPELYAIGHPAKG